MPIWPHQSDSEVAVPKRSGFYNAKCTFGTASGAPQAQAASAGSAQWQASSAAASFPSGAAAQLEIDVHTRGTGTAA